MVGKGIGAAAASELDISYPGANARLSYTLKGSHVAKLRCSRLAISYGVVSEESHAKKFRALYPHQRVQGSFAMTFDFIHWKECVTAMHWFRDYIEAVTEQSNNPSYMQVQLDNRKFLRLAYPTTGLVFGDHKGSMVFSPTILFVSVADPRDVNSGIQTLNNAISQPDLPPNALSTKWFYPDSRLNNPGRLQSYLYDRGQQAAAAAAAAAQNAIQRDAPTDSGDQSQQIPPTVSDNSDSDTIEGS